MAQDPIPEGFLSIDEFLEQIRKDEGAMMEMDQEWDDWRQEMRAKQRRELWKRFGWCVLAMAAGALIAIVFGGSKP